MNELIQRLRATQLEVAENRSIKDEFVTCGGVRLREMNFKPWKVEHTGPTLRAKLLDSMASPAVSIFKRPGRPAGLRDTRWLESTKIVGRPPRRTDCLGRTSQRRPTTIPDSHKFCIGVIASICGNYLQTILTHEIRQHEQ